MLKSLSQKVKTKIAGVRRDAQNRKRIKDAEKRVAKKR